MSVLLADIDATCAALGYYDGEKYYAESDAIQGLKHLIWILRRDIDNHEYRRHLGRATVLQTDLVPMLPDHIDDSDYADVLIRLLVILTNPTMLLYRDGLPKDGPGRKVYLELIEILQGYKEAFTSPGVWAALTSKLHNALETEWSIRSEEQGLLIERILVLVRNVLQVPANPELECRPDNDASLHDQVIWALQQSGMLDLVLYVLSSADENQYHLHALEIVCLMFREQTAESLADASLQRSASEKHRDEEELVAVRKRERQKAVLRPPPARHSRFGGTYVLQNMKSISDRDIICHQSLERAVSMDFDREKTKLKKSHRIVKETANVERRSAFSVRLCLREYCIEVLRSAYNTLVRQVRRVLERSTGTGSGAHDDSYLLWAIRFFLEFNRLSGMQLELVSESLSVQCFHWVLTRIQHDMDMIMTDKKQAQLWGRRLHVGIQTFRELLLSLIELKRQRDEKAQALFDMLLNNICYVLEYRETILHLLISFNESWSTKSYLRDIIETANMFFKLMEKFCQTPVVVQEKHRQRKKASKKTQREKPASQQTDETQAELEDMWSNIVTELSALVTQPELNIPEENLPIPFDAASEKSIDDQKDDCMLRIYKFLREEKPLESVALLRAAREVWPENDCFGAISAAPEDELMLLREIFFSRLGPVAPPSKDDHNANDAEEENEEEDEDDEEEDEPEPVERDFKFEDYAKRLLNPKIVRACVIALTDWEIMPTKSLKATVTILYRIAFEMKCSAMLFLASIFKIFQNVFSTPRDKHNEELRRLGVYVVRQFVELAPKNPKIYAELLFYKSLKEANDLENGYADTYHGATKGAWTEEQENELRMLFEENQRSPANDQDVIDWILDNLIDKTRTRRGVLKKLNEMGLMFKAPTKKSTAAAASKNLWQHEEDELLSSLYDEHRLENDCLERIVNVFGEKRNKNHIIKRMIHLGLIANRSEIIPKKTKKSRSKKQSSDNSDSEGEQENIKEKRKTHKNKPKQSKSQKKKVRSNVKSPLDVASVKFLLAQIDDSFKDAIDWLKESLKDASDDIEEISEDNDDGVPLLPLQTIEKDAMEDETFKRLLIAIGIQPPVEEMDTYWKIPVYLTAADLKMRIQVLDGTYTSIPVEVASAFGKDDDVVESEVESDSSQGSNEDTASSASETNESSDDDDANGEDSHATFISKRREHFDNLVFNQSDNEDEHRAPTKRAAERKCADAKKVDVESMSSKTRGRRSKKIAISDMLMEAGPDEGGFVGNEGLDNEEDFESENLRKRLAELIDDDNDDDDIDNSENSKSKTTRRIRRTIIDSDSSDGEVGNNENINQKDAIDGGDNQKNDDQSSITMNGNNKVNTADDKPRRQHVDVNNQSSMSLANSSGELGELPSNSLRMSPTPEDEDYVANVSAENHKRSRSIINTEMNDEDDDDEIVAKRKRTNESDKGNRRWTAIIDDDSD